MSKSHPTIRRLKGTSVDTTWGTCKDCGRRGLLHSKYRTCIEAARIPACQRRKARADGRAEVQAEKAAAAAQLLAAFEAEFGEAIPD